MVKTIIAPIVAFIVLILQLFGIVIPPDVVNDVIMAVGNVVAVGVVVYGIIKNHFANKE